MKVEFIEDVKVDGKVRFAKGLVVLMSTASAHKFIALGVAREYSEPETTEA